MANGAGVDIVELFRQGFQTVTRHPILIVAPLIAQVVGAILAILFLGGAVGMGVLLGGLGGMAGGSEGMAAGGLAGLIGGFVLFGLGIAILTGLLSLVASGVVVVMARDALAGREPGLGPALSAVLDRLGAVVVASALVTVLVGVGMLLFVLPGVAAMFLLMFALPAVLLDGTAPVEGLKRSVAVVRANLGPTLGFVVGAIVAIVAASIASAIVGYVPVLGHLVSAVIFGALISYLTVVGVSLYQALSRA
jgi:hypothetical protein